MSKTPHIFRADSLTELLSSAYDAVLRCGTPSTSARGRVRRLQGMTLVWEKPDENDVGFGWTRDDTERYLARFVDKRRENRPERLAEAGEMLFAYTYAARSRFRSEGWAAVVATLEATRRLRLSLSEVIADEEAFRDYLVRAGEWVHVQTLLSVWAWLGVEGLEPLLTSAHTLLAVSRRDQLARIIDETRSNPATRRAITASMLLPVLDHQLRPLLAVPPYQSFQLLPASGADAPLDSLHLHRSLDAAGGIPLDLHHDLRWLREASAALGRPVGRITVVASDFHVYEDVERDHETLDDWLLRVTDGYRSGDGTPARLIDTPAYDAVVKDVFDRARRRDGSL